MPNTAHSPHSELAEFENYVAENIGNTLTRATATGIAVAAGSMVSRLLAKPIPESGVDEAELADQDRQLDDLLHGQRDAIELFKAVVEMAHGYDDLMDGDSPVGAETIRNLIARTLTGFKDNEFYRRHRSQIDPILIVGLLNWFAANEMERIGRIEELRLAHVIRCSVGDVLLMLIYLIRGLPGAANDARVARLLTQGNEPWGPYRDEHSKE